jgi:hypothetical protein
MARLEATLTSIPAPDPSNVPEDVLHFTFRHDTDFDGNPTWYWNMGGRIGEEVTTLDPASRPEEAILFAEAEEVAKADISVQHAVLLREGRWWLNSYMHRDFIDANLHQVLRISEGERHIDVANATAEEFSEEQIYSIQKVFNAVANYTGGKIFDRVKSVSILPESEFAEGMAGNHSHITEMVNINAALFEKDDYFDARYAPFFKPGTVTPFEITLAHELGHAMDIRTEQEAKDHNINLDEYDWSTVLYDKTTDFSAFDNKFGWEHSVVDVDPAHPYATRNTHRMDATKEIEARELAPTDYALDHPGEDLAESFAIDVLNGRSEIIPGRTAYIGQTILKASGEATIGPKRVTATLLKPSEVIKPIDSIALTALVPKKA